MIKAQTHLPTKISFFSCVGGVMKFCNIGERQMKQIKICANDLFFLAMKTGLNIYRKCVILIKTHKNTRL